MTSRQENPSEACVQLLQREYGKHYEALTKSYKLELLSALGKAIALMDDPPDPEWGGTRYDVDEAWNEICDHHHDVLLPELDGVPLLGFDFEGVTGMELDKLIRSQFEAIAQQIAQKTTTVQGVN